LRLPIQEVFTITGHGTVPVGRVETGVLKVGDTVIFEPEGIKSEVKSIEMHHQSMANAEPGDNIGFSVDGVEKTALRRGSVVGLVSNPPTVVDEFKAQIVVLTPNINLCRLYSSNPYTYRPGCRCYNRDYRKERSKEWCNTSAKS